MTWTVDSPEVELVVLVTDWEQWRSDLVARLRAELHGRRRLAAERWRLTLVDNGSTDHTGHAGGDLVRPLDDVNIVHLPAHLSRRELRARWADSPARTVAFLEIGPDTDLESLLARVFEHASSDGRAGTVERPQLSGLVDRRTALVTIGGIGLTALAAACAGGSSSTAEPSTSSSTRLPSSSTAPGKSSSTTTAAVHPVALAPEIMEGPYYLHLNEIRSNITEDRTGAPLALNLIIVDAATGAPVKGAAVDIWHADGEGLYSGFVKTSADVNNVAPSSADDGTFLRGTQITDSHGRVSFATIYPGWYSGRAVHIHVKVHANGTVIHTGQLYFDDALTDKVFASVAPYSARGKRDVRNATDSLYGAPGRKSTLVVTKRGGDYTTTMTLGMKSV